ncbi:MAG: MFS transporter [Nanoarchaeota archaeon]|nr:MFS transporter [Nanoarchaeota archaeon]
MYVHHYKYRELLLKNELLIIFFLFTLSYSIVVGTMAIYLYEKFMAGSSLVGLVNILISLSLFIGSYLASPILLKFHEKKLLYFSIISLIILTIIIPLINSISVFIIFIILGMTFVSFRTVSFNILYRDSLDQDSLTSKEGILFSFFNVGFFLSIFLASAIISTYPIEYIYYLSAFFLSIGLLLLFNIDIKDNRDENEPLNFKNVISNLKLFLKIDFYRNLYFTSSGIHFYWAFKSYFALMMFKEGYSASEIGFVISLCFIPLILNDYYASKLSDKIKFRNLFLIGYSITIISLGLAFFFESYTIKIILVIIASLGYSFIEPTREILFFKKTSLKDEEKYYPIQSSCNFLGLIIGNLIFALFFLTSIPENYLFLVASISLSVLLIFVIKIKY